MKGYRSFLTLGLFVCLSWTVGAAQAADPDKPADPDPAKPANPDTGKQLPEPSLQEFEGVWKVTFHPNDTVRHYAITQDGIVYFDEMNTQGKITVAFHSFLLKFPTEPQSVERLTMGRDGRLFVEHFNPQAQGHFPDEPDNIGIGVH